MVKQRIFTPLATRNGASVTYYLQAQAVISWSCCQGGRPVCCAGFGGADAMSRGAALGGIAAATASVRGAVPGLEGRAPVEAGGFGGVAVDEEAGRAGGACLGIGAARAAAIALLA
jgi:hypothetical protein